MDREIVEIDRYLSRDSKCLVMHKHAYCVRKSMLDKVGFIYLNCMLIIIFGCRPWLLPVWVYSIVRRRIKTDQWVVTKSEKRDCFQEKGIKKSHMEDCYTSSLLSFIWLLSHSTTDFFQIILFLFLLFDYSSIDYCKREFVLFNVFF